MINNNSLISIAMATYNGSLFLLSQLDSIINQTYKNIEIIIVDDCSSDDTVKIIRQYQKLHTNIKLVQNPVNLGIVKTFAYAISLCSGEYIALADQDDIWFSNKLERLLENIGDNLLIHSDAVLVDENMQVIANSNMQFKDKFKSGFEDYLISNNVTGCTALFSRKLLELALPIPDEFYIHDHYLALIASFYGSIKFLDIPLVYYRQHGSNFIGAKRPRFNYFILNCKAVADSYSILLKSPVFKNNFSLELIHDYRLSIYLGKWVSKFSIFKLFQLKHGLKLFIYYILIGGLFGRTVSGKIYNFLYKIK
ncbi:MAG: glycosyltransferase family 2 protein [Burkholderiales bacterium]|jgi:glycosyltransferase involved in cell wall biosynthesis|nr:glycosyltransferase family 2 protein [Burkholderiales bacterium]